MPHAYRAHKPDICRWIELLWSVGIEDPELLALAIGCSASYVRKLRLDMGLKRRTPDAVLSAEQRQSLDEFRRKFRTATQRGEDEAV
jgi:hypothetical protein